MLNKELLKKFVGRVEELTDKDDILRETIIFIKQSTASDAVGIRLKSRGDYPYYTTLGFTNYFVKLENFLCEKDKKNRRVLRPDGCLSLQCMCGAVIDGKIKDPKYFTEFGSFYTPSTSETINKQDIDSSDYTIRGNCNKFGYESVLIIPIPIKSENIGVIQINSFSKSSFDKKTIETLEEIAAMIGAMLDKLNLIKHLDNDNPKTIMKKSIYKSIAELQNITQNILTKNATLAKH